MSTGRAPSVTGDSTVTLAEVTRDNLRTVLALKVGPEQCKYVAPNAVSIAEAHFQQAAWFRAIEAGGTPVGFVMLFDPGLPGATPEQDVKPDEIWLWRFLIDHRYQRLGLGRKALDLVIAHARTRPDAARLMASYVPGDGSPRDFYLDYGFAETGRTIEDGTELVIACPL